MLPTPSPPEGERGSEGRHHLDTREPIVRIRPVSPEDDARCRRILGGAGLSPETSLTWLVVRDADPDEVNRLLVAGGALGRVVLRERIGQLVGWLIDRQGALEGRSRNVVSLVERALKDGGLAQRYRAREPAAALEAARALHRRILEEGAPFLPWSEFREAFCQPMQR